MEPEQESKPEFVVNYFVRGRKDGKERKVEHIPRDMSQPNTPVRVPEKNFKGFEMLYHGDSGISRRVVSADRIEHRVVSKRFGLQL